MLKEHLQKHFNKIKTIQLKRHHYILGGLGIAAITVIASIFGFQNIGTHAAPRQPGTNPTVCNVVGDSSHYVELGHGGTVTIICQGDELLGSIPDGQLIYNRNVIEVRNQQTQNGSHSNERLYIFGFIGTHTGHSPFGINAKVMGDNAVAMLTNGIEIYQEENLEANCNITINSNILYTNLGYATGNVTCSGVKESLTTGELTYNHSVIEITELGTEGEIQGMESQISTIKGDGGTAEYSLTFQYRGIGSGKTTIEITGDDVEYLGIATGVKTSEITVLEPYCLRDSVSKRNLMLNETGTASFRCYNVEQTIKSTDITNEGNILNVTNFDVTSIIEGNIISERGGENQGKGGEVGKIYTFTYEGVLTGTTKLTITGSNATTLGIQPIESKSITVTEIPNCTIKVSDTSLIIEETGTGSITCSNFTQNILESRISHGNAISIKNRDAGTPRGGTSTATFTYKGENTGNTKIEINETGMNAIGLDETVSSYTITVSDYPTCRFSLSNRFIQVNETGTGELICENYSDNLYEGFVEYGDEISITEWNFGTPKGGENSASFTYKGKSVGITNIEISSLGLQTIGLQNNVQSESITVEHDIYTDCERPEPIEIDKNTSGTIVLTCDTGNLPLFELRNNITITTYSGNAPIITTGETKKAFGQTREQTIYNLTFTGTNTGNVKLTINGIMKNGSINYHFGNKTNGEITVKDTTPTEYSTVCEWQDETARVASGDEGKIVLTCNTADLPVLNLREIIDINTNRIVITTGAVSHTIGEFGNQGNTKYDIKFTGIHSGNAQLTINGTLEKGGIRYTFSNGKNTGNIEIYENPKPTGPDCTVTAEPASVTIGQGGTITVQCTGEKVATGDIRNAIKTNEKVNVEEYPSEQTNIGDSNIKLVYQFTGAQVGTSYVLLLENRINSNGTRNGIVTGNDIEVKNNIIECSRGSGDTSIMKNNTGGMKLTCPESVKTDTLQAIIKSLNTTILDITDIELNGIYNGVETTKEYIVTYIGINTGTTQLIISGNIDGYIYTGGTSENITVIDDKIYATCSRGEPSKPIIANNAETGYITLECPKNISGYTNSLISTIAQTTPETLGIEEVTSEGSIYTIVYTGKNLGITKLKLDGRLTPTIHLSDGGDISDPIEVIAAEKPKCEIRIHPTVLPRQRTGQITITCDGTNRGNLTSNGLDYDNNIIELSNITQATTISGNTVYSMNFTGINLGYSPFGVRTGAISQGTISNDYIAGDDILVIGTGRIICNRTTPNPQEIAIGGNGKINLTGCDFGGVTYGILEYRIDPYILALVETTNDEGKISFATGRRLRDEITYTGIQQGFTHFNLDGNINEYVAVYAGESDKITVYSGIFEGCEWKTPISPIGIGATGHIDLMCDNLVANADTANGVWDTIKYSTNAHIINTGNADFIDGGVRFYYSGNQTGTIKLLASGSAQGYLYLSSGRSNNIEVTDKAPTINITSSTTINTGKQTATGTCTDEQGIIAYYWGTNNNPTDEDFTTIPNTTTVSKTWQITTSGTYYFACKNTAGNKAQTNITYVRYNVKNMLDKIEGTTGTYTTNNYATYSTKPSTSTYYVIPQGTNITLLNLCNRPVSRSTLQATSIGNPNTTPATDIETGSASNTTYTCWYDRNTYQLELVAGTGISSVTGSGTYKHGQTGNISATTQDGFTFSQWIVTAGNNGPIEPQSNNTQINITTNTTLLATASDGEHPKCSRGNPSKTILKGGESGTIVLTCEDNGTITTTHITGADIIQEISYERLRGNEYLIISDADAEGTDGNKTFEFTYTAKSNVNGKITLKLPKDKVQDNEGNQLENDLQSKSIYIDSIKPECEIIEGPTKTEIKIGETGTIKFKCTSTGTKIQNRPLQDDAIDYSGGIVRIEEQTQNFGDDGTGYYGEYELRYRGVGNGQTTFKLKSGQVNDDAGNTNDETEESDEVKVYIDIFSGCRRGEPTYDPIAVGVDAYIDLNCNGLQYDAENDRDVWRAIIYSPNGNADVINTGNAEVLTGKVRFHYSGAREGQVSLIASGDSYGYLYLSEGESNPIHVIANSPENGPTCTITGTEMVVVGQTGTITVKCNGNGYPILTNQILSGDIIYNGNTIEVGNSNIDNHQSLTKTFRITFTGTNTGISNLALNTGAVINTPGIQNTYTTGNDIIIVNNEGIACQWKPQPNVIGIGETGMMKLDCAILSTIREIRTEEELQNFLRLSGSSVTGHLEVVDGQHEMGVLYTGEEEGVTQFAISGTVGNVHIQTNAYRSSGVTVTNDGIELHINPQEKISNQNITVNMSGRNANWVRYYTTGTASLDFNVCKEYGTQLEENGGVFNGTETITNNEEGTKYIYLCGAQGSDRTGMIIGTYKIDTTKPECEITANPREWTNSGVILSVTNINELNPYLYSWTGFNEGEMSTTTGTKTVYTTGTYSFYMKDAAGNTGICSTGVTNIDTQDPIFNVIIVDGYNLYECQTGTAEITYVSGGVSGLPTNAYIWNGITGNSTTYSQYSSIVDTQNITVSVIDNAGNITETGITFNWQDVELQIGNTNQSLGQLTGEKVINNVITDLNVTAGVCESITPSITGHSHATCTLNGNKLTITPQGNYNGNGYCTIAFTDGDTTKTGKYTFTVNTIVDDLTLELDPAGSEWVGNPISVHMIATNTTGAKFLLTGESGISFDTCRNATNGGILVSESATPTIYEGTTTINTNGINYLYLCATSLTGQEEMISGIYKIDTEGFTGDVEYENVNGEIGNSCTTGNITIKLNTGESISGYPEKAFARNSTGNSAWTGNNTKTATENESGTGYIRDNAGHIIALPYNVTGIVNEEPTTPTLQNPGNGDMILSSNTEFTWTESQPDNCATINGYTMYILSGTDIVRSGSTNGTGIIPISLPNGIYSRYVVVTDNFGQTAQSTQRTFEINNNMPECSITYEPPYTQGFWTNQNVTGTLTCTDTGVNIITGTNVFTENGDLPFSVEDSSNNIRIITGHVTWIDKTPPYVSGHTNTTTGWYTGDLVYSFIYADTGAGISGEDTISCTISEEGTGQACSITGVNICDKVGNCNNKPVVSQAINLDKSNPICGTRSYNPGSGTLTTGNVEATLTGSYDTISQIDISGGSCTVTGYNQNCNVTISDNAGNTEVCTSENVTWIDTGAPILHEVTPIGTTTDTTPDYTFSSTEPGIITYSGACSSATTGAVSGNNTITLNQLAYGTYSGCTITVTDSLGHTSDVLTISTFTIRQGGGGGGGGLHKDNCPDGDYSDSYYDGTCEGPKDICGVSKSKYDTELKTAYLYAYTHKMTTMCPIEDANLYGVIRRDELAKMLTEYALEVLDLEPEAGKSGCTAYNDIANSSAEMKYYMKTACELNIMGLESDGKTPMKSFYPAGLVSRAEFGTTLSRLIYGDAYNLESEAENTYPGAWYGKHLEALKRDEIMTKIYGDRPQHLELRGYVMLMIMRHGKARLDNVKNVPYSTKEEILEIYNKNKALTCEVSYYESADEHGTGMIYVKDNKLRENYKIYREGNASALIKNNKLYVRGDAIGTGMGMVVDTETTALEELEALLEDETYTFKNCNEAVKNINAFELPSNVKFKTLGDWFTELSDSFTNLFD